MPDRRNLLKATPDDAPLYETKFVRQCFRLIAVGYSRLDRQALSTAEEPSITGELVRAMKAAQCEEVAPRWMDYFFVADDPPVNRPGKLGKRRPRVDIEFERGRRPRSRLQFEAKRLYRSDSISEYIGPTGLGMFLSGEYAADQNVAGMLGYVQAEKIVVWIDRIKSAFSANPRQFCIKRASGTEPTVASEFADVHLSHHERPSTSQSIAIYHALLSFISGSD